MECYSQRTIAQVKPSPEDVGIPDIVPVAGFSVNPGGSVPPSMVQVIGGSPPVAVSVAE